MALPHTVFTPIHHVHPARQRVSCLEGLWGGVTCFTICQSPSPPVPRTTFVVLGCLAVPVGCRRGVSLRGACSWCHCASAIRTIRRKCVAGVTPAPWGGAVRPLLRRPFRANQEVNQSHTADLHWADGWRCMWGYLSLTFINRQTGLWKGRFGRGSLWTRFTESKLLG